MEAGRLFVGRLFVMPKTLSTAIIGFTLIWVFLFGNWRMCLAYDSGSSWKPLRTQNHIGQCPSPVLAELIDKGDRIIYSTDPEMERAMREEKRREEEKQDKSWQMLQHMNIYKGGAKRHNPVSGNGTAPQNSAVPQNTSTPQSSTNQQ